MNGEADPPRPIGRIIKRAREKRRWSQQAAADMLSVSRSTLNKWENDRAYPRSAIGALEELYGVVIDDAPAEPKPPPVPPAIAESVRLAEGLTDEDRARVLEAIAATLRGDPPPTGPGAADPSPGERRAG